MSSRYGASLLTAAGCADLVGGSAGEYIEIAVGLARQPQRLSELRQNLRRMCEKHGLANSMDLAKRLERAYEEMLRQRWRELPRNPAHSASKVIQDSGGRRDVRTAAKERGSERRFCSWLAPARKPSTNLFGLRKPRAESAADA
jgi:hypothetical protein